jgi:hypothetical protein
MAGFRNLLGSDAKAIHHDPGAKGESGEGDAAIVMLCLTYVAAFAIIVYGASHPAKLFFFSLPRPFPSRLASSLPYYSCPPRRERLIPSACANPCGRPPPLQSPGVVWVLLFLFFDS